MSEPEVKHISGYSFFTQIPPGKVKISLDYFYVILGKNVFVQHLKKIHMYSAEESSCKSFSVLGKTSKNDVLAKF
jgi:hypothetical protein